jgi:hypothetical protein
MAHPRTRALALATVLLGAGGCVTQERHDHTMTELKHARYEAYQRGIEASALRAMLDRVTVELRTREPPSSELTRRFTELAVSYSDLSKRYVACASGVAAQQAAAPRDPLPALTNTPAPPRKVSPERTDPRGRKIGDRLFDDR